MKKYALENKNLTPTWIKLKNETFNPLSRVKKAGNSHVSYPMTGTPCVSRTSSVRGKSSIDFAPAQMTQIGVLPSSGKSALMSIAT